MPFNQDAGRLQHTEEAFRVADSCERLHCLPQKSLEIPGLLTAIHGVGLAPPYLHEHFSRFGNAIGDNQIDTAQATREFSERTGRQAKAIAKAAFSIYHNQFQIPLQGIMLQPVIGDDNVACLFRQQSPPRLKPIRSGIDRTGGTSSQEYRLITYG